ncbi:MAG: glycosyltransferase family 4 protein [Muribaculaceae bacterium]
MKILLINRFHYRKGGSEAVYFNTAELLRRAGHEVVFFSFVDEKNEDCEQAVFFVNGMERVSRLKGIRNYFYNSEARRNLELLIERERPDVAHVHLLWGGMSPSIFGVLKRHGIPLVHTAHDYRMVCPAYTFNCNGRICEECHGSSFYKCALKKCSKGNALESVMMAMEMYWRNAFFSPENNLAGIIYVSDFSRNKHLQYRRTLGNVLSMVLYNCTQEPDVDLTGHFRRDYFLFFGRLSYEKGVDRLIDVFERMPERKLKIVGTGPIEDGLKDEVASRGLKNIEFIGYKAGRELKELVANASFVIVPSQCYENNPMTVIEAYSLQTPVIGSDLGGIPEIIDNGKTGFVFSHDDMNGLVKVIEDAAGLSDAEYRKMSLNARRFFDEHFSENGYAEKLVEFYKSVMKI